MITRSLFAYVGSYTTPERNGHGNGINVYRVDRRSGALRHIQHVGGLENPSFLALNAAGDRLYSVHGDRSEATSYTVDRETGRLAVLNRQPTGGYNPIHLAFDAGQRFLVVSNYGSDSLAALPIARDGGLAPYATLTTVAAPLGPHRTEQKKRAAASQSTRSRRADLLPALQGLGLRDRATGSTHGAGVLVETSRVAARPGRRPRVTSTSIRAGPSPTSSTSSIRRSRPIVRNTASGALTPLQTVPSTPVRVHRL